jgi:glycosyltransferase involved in cell wall biosynthesis
VVDAAMCLHAVGTLVTKCISLREGTRCFEETPNDTLLVRVNSGRSTETIKDRVTGFLCPPTAQAFSAALASLISDPLDRAVMARAGREHVMEHFSRHSFGHWFLRSCPRKQ